VYAFVKELEEERLQNGLENTTHSKLTDSASESIQGGRPQANSEVSSFNDSIERTPLATIPLEIKSIELPKSLGLKRTYSES
jgi:hypothetical protein